MRLLILSVFAAVALLPACNSRPAPPRPALSDLKVITAPTLEAPPQPMRVPTELAFASAAGVKAPQVW